MVVLAYVYADSRRGAVSAPIGCASPTAARVGRTFRSRASLASARVVAAIAGACGPSMRGPLRTQVRESVRA